MKNHFFKGDIVKVTHGDLAGHMGKVKSVSKIHTAYLDVDKSVKPRNPITGRAISPKIPLEYLEVVQGELIPHEGRAH